MPINIPDALPAKDILESENIFVMTETRALHQDIRPLKILILNLMPKKIDTEIQLLRQLSNTPLQVDVELIHPQSHESKNTSQKHLNLFYKHWEEIQHKRYDGMIITGAPVERLKFEEVDYWDELQKIMEWSQHHVTSTMHICWAAQAGLYYHFQVPKYPLENKMFGVFPHEVHWPNEPLVKGFDEGFLAPHSRHTEVRNADILANERLSLLASSQEAGAYIVMSKDRRNVFVTGHAEYDPKTLEEEYVRDKNLGMDVQLPKNYYREDNPEKGITVKWRSHAQLLFSNWLNYCVYQVTPYDIETIG
jgi:homoserine O-succinyltransferase